MLAAGSFSPAKCGGSPFGDSFQSFVAVLAPRDDKDDDLSAAESVVGAEIAAAHPEQGRVEAGEFFDPALSNRYRSRLEIRLDIFDDLNCRFNLESVNVPDCGRT